MVEIEKVQNGFIVNICGQKEIAASTEDVFRRLLEHYEGRCEQFNGDSYGKVKVYRCTCHQSDGNSCCSMCGSVGLVPSPQTASAN